MAANTCNQPPFRGNGTGAQADYVFGFEFINRADVEVYVGEPGNWTQFTEGNAANANEYQWQNDTTIRLNAASGTNNVLITRETDRCDPAVEFFAGTSIRAEDLNANQEQTLFLIQELAETMSENGMDQPPGSDGITLDDLEDVNITTPANPSWLRWNGTEWQDQPILEDGDTWVADDNHVVTAARGDARWLNSTGGDIVGRDMITATENAGTIQLDVDLAAVSGLESTDPGNAGGELRIDVNDGCEIVAAGLNAETTDASIVQTGGNNDDPAIRIATTLGTAVTNNDLQITGGANVTVTRNSNTQLTIASAAATGGAIFRGTVDVDNDNTLPATTGQQNPNAVAIGDGFTVENNVAANDVTANWNTVLDNWDVADGIINSGDVILCTTAAAAGSPTDARYNLIRTGGNINTLQQVTDAGNTTTSNILLQTGTNTNTSLNADGSAVFNERGQDVNFRVEGVGQVNALVVDGTNGRVGIGEATPAQPLDVNGNATIDGSVTIEDGNNLILQNADEDQTVSINADDATATYNITLPPAAPAAGTRYLRAAGTGTGADQELEWATGGGGATGGNTATQQDYVFQENAQAVRHNYTIGTTLAAQPGSGVTTIAGGGAINNSNALSAGPITINNGVTVTIENGSNWVVI